MTRIEAPVRPAKDPEAALESVLIAQFLKDKGVDGRAIGSLPEPEGNDLLAAASVYAAGKLAEVEARAHLLRELHGAA